MHIHAPPRGVLPRNSGPHREAAVALFRALLTQCRAVPGLQTNERDELQNAIRHRFKQARFEQSPRRLRLNFAAGYQGIDVLDSASTGDPPSIAYIRTLLAHMPPHLKLPPPTILPRALRDELAKKTRAAAAAAKEQRPPKAPPSIWDRPLPAEQLSGPRHIPVLFSANGYPVLRIKKPQPRALSRMLAAKIKRRQKRFDMRNRLEGELEVARWEDEWDGFFDGEEKEEEDGFGRVGWEFAVKMARADVLAKIEAEKRQNRDMALKMQEIVDRERELWVEENAAKKKASEVE